MRRSTHRIAVTLALGLAALATTVSAQPRLTLPEGITTDRFSADPWAASLDVGLSNFDGAPGTTYGTRVDFYGQILGQFDAHRVGGYVALPYGRIEADEDTGLDDSSKVGHLELGGLFATTSGATTDAVLRGGVAVGLHDDNASDSFAVFATSYGRLSETLISLPAVTWLRLSGSLLHDSDPYFMRADLGLDVPFTDGDDGNFLVRANLAAGIDIESVVLLGELSNLALFADGDGEQFLSTFAFTLRMRTGTFSPCMGVVVPFDDVLQDAVDFVFVVGVRTAGGR